MEQDLDTMITRIDKLRCEFDDYSVADIFKDLLVGVLAGKFDDLPNTTHNKLKDHLDHLLTTNHL